MWISKNTRAADLNFHLPGCLRYFLIYFVLLWTTFSPSPKLSLPGATSSFGYLFQSNSVPTLRGSYGKIARGWVWKPHAGRAHKFPQTGPLYRDPVESVLVQRSCEFLDGALMQRSREVLRSCEFLSRIRCTEILWGSLYWDPVCQGPVGICQLLPPLCLGTLSILACVTCETCLSFSCFSNLLPWLFAVWAIPRSQLVSRAPVLSYLFSDPTPQWASSSPKARLLPLRFAQPCPRIPQELCADSSARNLASLIPPLAFSGPVLYGSKAQNGKQLLPSGFPLNFPLKVKGSCHSLPIA